MSEKKSTTSIVLALNDSSTLTIISYHLERYGFIVNAAQSNEMLLEMVRSISPNIIIIDEDTPGTLKAKELCHFLKYNEKTKNIKIILVSKEKQKNIDSIDDYIVKPFVPSEVVNKIKAFVPQGIQVNHKKILSFKDVEMNVSIFRVMRGDKVIHLGPNEFKILQCFLELPDKILSREHIMNYVWGKDVHVEPRTIDVHINRLRSALARSDDKNSLIKTIRSSGYVLSNEKVMEEA